MIGAMGDAADTRTHEPELWLVRHGETEWSRDGRHTSFTDLPLTENGVRAAETLRARLGGERFDLVLTSPRDRARRTAEMAGFPDAVVEEDLVEWDYGNYEGVTTAQIREHTPGWTVWTHASPGGESAEQVGERLDRVVTEVRAHGGRVLAFGHGHALRALAARWVGLPVTEGRALKLDTATVSTLGYEHESPVILRWNC
jgi:probable phosphoglycerate mutase